MKKILLASNGDFAIESLRLFFDDLSEIKLAYITTASKGSRNLEYLEWHRKKLNDFEIDYEEIDIEGKNENELRKTFKDKNVIFVEGGNTFYLLKAVRESGFDKVVRELIEQGIIYMGSSAGSYIACPTIEMATWKKPGEEKNNFGVTDLNAMSLVPFLVKAHYFSDQEEFLQKKISDYKKKKKINTIRLRDGQAILLENDNYKMIHSEENLLNIFSPHIKAEINTFKWCYKKLMELYPSLKVVENDEYQKVLHECFLLHARNLYDFLYEKPKYWHDDVSVLNFGIELLSRDEELKKLKKRIDKQLAHITYDRLSKNQEDLLISTEKIYNSIQLGWSLASDDPWLEENCGW